MVLNEETFDEELIEDRNNYIPYSKGFKVSEVALEHMSAEIGNASRHHLPMEIKGYFGMGKT